jgi:acylphosphatase
LEGENAVQANGPQRREVYYNGSVQGVGFRFTARQLAVGFDVAGYVKNLPDGRVFLVAEGPAAEIERFLATVSRAMAHYIDSVEQTTHPVTGEFRGFAVRH